MKYGLVVEDHAALTRWLADTLLGAFPDIEIATVTTLAAGREAVARRVPDIALVDLGLPDGDGIELIREITSEHPDCHCVVTTIYADDQHLFPALRAGASGYLLKDQSRERLIGSLLGIASGAPPLSASVARRLLRVFNEEASTRENVSQARLTPRERETLTLLAKGFKIADVAESLGITHHTAHGFVKSIYRKLKIGTRAEAAVEAARLGLINPHL